MRLVARGRVGVLNRLWSRPKRRYQLLALLVGLGIAVTVWALRGYISGVEAVGYPSVFFLSFLGSVSMVLPVPGLISVCGTSVFLSPIIIGLLSGLGESMGEVSGYAVGYGGGSVIEKRRFYPKLKAWMDSRGTLVIFLVSVIPNPLFDLVGIAAGGVRYPFFRFLGIVFVGKTLKGVLVAYTCFYGITSLPWVNLGT